ncbi:DUF2255 family protein [Microbacterium sp. NPDC087868]|uniref:DUF2255 family protein n=1 Tax=Microbacterium sp. NPDC087868 TaxID=3364195 RepID=UPI00384C8F70
MDWDENTLDRIVQADDLKIAPLRADRKTYGTPTWIWAVAVGNDLYVRAYNGIRSRWYQAAIANPEGRVIAAGDTFDVVFEPAPAAVEDAVSDAYREKYRGSTYLPHMIAAGPVSATVRILPGHP